jgi:hypothetical protein
MRLFYIFPYLEVAFKNSFQQLFFFFFGNRPFIKNRKQPTNKPKTLTREGEEGVGGGSGSFPLQIGIELGKKRKECSTK